MFRSFVKKLNNQKGMTLIEIMVVVAIIGSIAALVTVNVMDYLAESKVETTKITIKNLESALEQYKRKANAYPSTEQGLQALVEKPTIGKVPENYPADGFIKRVPEDAWGNELSYTSPGTGGHPYEITSLGADGSEGGENYDADLKSYELK